MVRSFGSATPVGFDVLACQADPSDFKLNREVCQLGQVCQLGRQFRHPRTGVLMSD
jgi:hypothetical protein